MFKSNYTTVGPIALAHSHHTALLGLMAYALQHRHSRQWIRPLLRLLARQEVTRG